MTEPLNPKNSAASSSPKKESKDEKNEILKNEISLYQPPTDFREKIYYNLASSSGVSYRLLLVIDATICQGGLYEGTTGLSLDVLFTHIVRLVTGKYSGKIFVALHKLQFSSYWELSRILGLGDMTSVRRVLWDMQAKGMVEEAKDTDQDYTVMHHFWKDAYATSPNQPKLFYVAKHFEQVAEAYSDSILRAHFTPREISMITKRSERWTRYHAQIRRQQEMVARIPIKGQCIQCGLRIRADAQEWKEYVEFKAGLVCRQCKDKATRGQIQQWLSMGLSAN